ncbi:MAG: acyl-CoA/acyl-ACP dehydrogenase [Thermomicrobium sp.]|nr:acyl-CoA/acyl-ACP dehydrogenase [Thermomicrobium sp.]
MTEIAGVAQIGSDELNQVRSAARELAQSFTLEYWREKDRTGEYPWEFVQAFANGGWLGALTPEEYGGLGLGITAAGIILSEAARSGGAAAASALHFQIFPAGPIIRHGSEEMKREFLPRLARGELRMCFAVTEPSSGVDLSRLRTTATRAEGGWVINGQKVWISNAQHAHKILLLARTSPRNDAAPLDGMTLFFIDLDRERIKVVPIDKCGRAAVDSNEVFIDHVQVSDDDVVGEVGQGFRYLLDGLNPERILVAFETIGIGRAALDLACSYADQRIVFDRPIGANQSLAHPLADSWIRLEAAELMALKAATLFDSNLACGAEANAAKFLGSEAGFEACDRAMQTLGGYSYSKEFHVERFWRESRLLKIAPISQEMVLNYIANKVLGLPRSY